MVFNKVNIIQFGCGGTGSYMVRPVMKFLRNLYSRIDNFECKYILIDGDYVEQRNIMRQNFTEDHFNRNKSEVLKFENDFIKLNTIECISQMITTKKQISNILDSSLYKFNSQSTDNEINIILGCVDNNKCRRLIYKYTESMLDYNIIYLDSGNNLYNGQIITSIHSNELKLKLNNVSFENIKFLKFFPLKPKTIDEKSCAFFGDQSQSINMFASTLLFMNIQKILIENIIPPKIINFNSSGFSTFDV